MLNAYDHEDADAARGIASSEKLPQIVELRDAAGRARRRDARLRQRQPRLLGLRNATTLVERALRRASIPSSWSRSRRVGRVPFFPKGRHSIFYQTALDHLLRVEEVERVVLVGQVTEQCILYSALDAYLRGYEVVVPPDAVAHIDEEFAEAALGDDGAQHARGPDARRPTSSATRAARSRPDPGRPGRTATAGSTASPSRPCRTAPCPGRPRARCGRSSRRRSSGRGPSPFGRRHAHVVAAAVLSA